ncbi:hypothetical protein INT45_008775 [Circinella minor]|uniref:Striatin N-terminal domain-containing protein n=1 Tax=Circinella minor TaxID=1195481 RepID=A0A8H7S060_9FUNG|nr:hypothetical protein INT45_008775 [Circinella minor]
MNISPQPEYSLPGVLHYLQVEWRRFERERNEWIIERAQMKARIALLEGERRGVEQVKVDLLKRVKMLEYALRQERKKYLAATNKQQPQQLQGNIDDDSPNAPSSPVIHHGDVAKKQQEELGGPSSLISKQQHKSELSTTKAKERSRHALKACLDEINYLTSMPTKFPLMPSLTTETSLRTHVFNSPSISHRQVPSSSSSSSEYSNHNSPELSNSNTASDMGTIKGNRSSSTTKQLKTTHSGSKRSNPFLTPIPKNKESIQSKAFTSTNASESQTTFAETMTEEGLISSNRSSSTSSIEGQQNVPANVDEVAILNNNNNNINSNINNKSNNSGNNNEDSNGEDVDMVTDADTDDTAIDENALLSKEMQEKYNLSEEKVQRMLKNTRKGGRRSSPEPQDTEFSLKGNLDPSQIGDIDEVSKKQEQKQSKIWKPRVTIKGHLDSVRAVSFHPTDMMVASGSDDGTVKIWNLKRSIGKDGTPMRKTAHDEADPVITYRGHNHIVTQVAISAEQNRVYSSSLDSTIRVWRLPSEGHSLYSPVGNMATYVGHTDAIWDFKLFPIADNNSCILASASADGTVKLWDTQTSGQLLKSSLTFDGVLSENGNRQDLPVPTSLDFCHTDLAKMAVSFSNAQIRIYDIETGQVIATLQGSTESFDGTVGTQINKIVAHPTMPLIVSGHEDRQIKFFDLKSGTCAFSMSAHLDSVACLDIDPSGMTLVSGGHDSSIRLWDISMSKTCMQEFSAHRRKGHEGVLSVQYHKAFPWMVSGGADSIAKVYHHGHQH